MTQRSTFGEIRWPMDDESLEQAQAWANSLADQVLDWTWRAFDQLQTNHLSRVDFQQPLEQIERDLTSKHFFCILELWNQETDGHCAIVPFHEFPELASRPTGAGKPPAYDLAFVWYENQRIAWPIEAKIVKTPKSLREYLRDVDKFCNGKAAPFVGQGGLIAYLLAGNPNDFFSGLGVLLDLPLTPWSGLARRSHRVSHHDRNAAPRICLHHMVMQMSKPSVAARRTRSVARKGKTHA